MRASVMHGDTAACHFDGIVRALCLSDGLRHHIKLDNNATNLAARQAAGAAGQALAEYVSFFHHILAYGQALSYLFPTKSNRLLEPCPSCGPVIFTKKYLGASMYPFVCIAEDVMPPRYCVS